MTDATTIPAAESAAYTPADLERAAAIVKWLAVHDKSRAWLGKKASIPSGTLSQILAGKYVSSPTKQLAQCWAVLELEGLRMQDGTPGYVQGSVHKLMGVVLNRTRKHQNFGVFTGYVGVGKTRTAKEYRTANPMTVLVESSPHMTPGVLLTELLAQLHTAMPQGLDRKFREVVQVLKGTNYLLIVDEAEKLSPSALEYLRRIRDMAQVGVVLVGTEKLTALIKPEHGQFDQVRSRVGMWPKTIERIKQDDMDEMARAALHADLTEEVLDALWAYSEGSARVLNENLVPALRDYCPKGQPLTAAMLVNVASKVLFMAPRAIKPRGEA